MSEHKWPTFKDGDRVWSLMKNRVVELKNVGNNMLSDGEYCYQFNGVPIMTSSKFPLLFHAEIKPEDWPQPPAPLPDLPVDAPIMVNEGGPWFKRHFARWENGHAVCWVEGLTSFTTKCTTCWKEWRLPTDEELGSTGHSF